MITKNNYYDKVKGISINDLPDTLKAGHEFVEEATGKGKDWSTYEGDKDIKEVIDLYFQKLNAYGLAHRSFSEGGKATKLVNSPKSASATKREKETHKPKASTQRKASTGNAKSTPKKSKKKPKTRKRKPATKFIGTYVEAYGDEILLIRRMLNMHEKQKTKHQVLLFINAIQRKILEKKVRKSSPYANQIKFIQGWLIDLYNKMGETVKLFSQRKNGMNFILLPVQNRSDRQSG